MPNIVDFSFSPLSLARSLGLSFLDPDVSKLVRWRRRAKGERERANRSERFLIFYKDVIRTGSYRHWHRYFPPFSSIAWLLSHADVSLESEPIEMMLMFCISCTFTLA